MTLQPLSVGLKRMRAATRGSAALLATFSNFLSMPMTTGGIGIGTSTTWIVRRGRGLVAHEPSCLALDRSVRGYRCVGQAAAQFDGREPADITLARPIAGGAVLDRERAIRLVRHFLRLGGAMHHGVVIALPQELTAAEQRTVEQVVLGAGARQVYRVAEPVAAAIGAGLAALEPQAVMTVDLGASSTRLSVMALGEIVQSSVLPVGGRTLDEALQLHLARVFQLKVGLPTAERVKRALGCAVPLSPAKTMDVDGMSLLTGLPTRLQVSSTDVYAALQPALGRIADHVRQTVEGLPPQILADVIDNDSIALIGGGAQLAGLQAFVQERANLSVRLPETAATATAVGVDRILSQAALRRAVLSAPSRAGVPLPRPQTTRGSYSLAWTLGLLSILLVWQMAAPLMARTSSVDTRLTAAMIPMWKTFSRLTSRPAPGPVAMDPIQHKLYLELQETQRQLHLATAENHRLRALIHMAGHLPTVTHSVAGQVVARDPSAWLQVLMLDVGRENKVAPGYAVLADGGVVGHLSEVSASSARVETITFQGATTAAIVARRHAAGVVYGMGGETCEMRFIDPNSGVKAGDQVTTSGQDRYPEGLSIGQVTQVRPASDGVSVIASVRPSVRLDTVRDVTVVQNRK